jgi:hypothetical protein
VGRIQSENGKFWQISVIMLDLPPADPQTTFSAFLLFRLDAMLGGSERQWHALFVCLNSSFPFDDDKIHGTEGGGEGVLLLSVEWRQNRWSQKNKGWDRGVTKCTDIFETKASARVQRVV